jgi:hypothetical protein
MCKKCDPSFSGGVGTQRATSKFFWGASSYFSPKKWVGQKEN